MKIKSKNLTYHFNFFNKYKLFNTIKKQVNITKINVFFNLFNKNKNMYNFIIVMRIKEIYFLNVLSIQYHC